MPLRRAFSWARATRARRGCAEARRKHAPQLALCAERTRLPGAARAVRGRASDARGIYKTSDRHEATTNDQHHCSRETRAGAGGRATKRAGKGPTVRVRAVCQRVFRGRAGMGAAAAHPRTHGELRFCEEQDGTRSAWVLACARNALRTPPAPTPALPRGLARNVGTENNLQGHAPNAVGSHRK
jgi:hypothetical protein